MALKLNVTEKVFNFKVYDPDTDETLILAVKAESKASAKLKLSTRYQIVEESEEK